MKFLEKPIVQVAIILGVCCLVGGGVYLTKQKTREERIVPSVQASNSLGKTTPEREVTGRGSESMNVVRNIVDTFELPPPKEPPPPEEPVVKVVREAAPVAVARPEQESVSTGLPSLVHVHIAEVRSPELAPEQPRIYGPRGLLIKAVLVLTVDSSDFDTPVLALVTEDVYWNGNLLVPAGTQVFAKAAQGNFRDRIEVKGQFTFVWADGREYKINALALDHETEQDGTFSLTDGSAGIKGAIIEPDNSNVLKMLAAQAIAGFAQGSQSSFNTPFGSVPERSTGNAAATGIGGAGNQYAELLFGKIEEELSYVRVAAGTEFYIFTEDVFEPDLASVGGLVQGNEARSSFDIQRMRREQEESRIRGEEEEEVQSGRRRTAVDSYGERTSELIRQNSNVTR